MKQHEQAQSELRDLLNKARMQGLCRTQKEFASLIGLDPSNFSALLNGAQNITEQMMTRIIEAATSAGVVMEGNGNGTHDTAGGDMQKTYNVDHTAELIAEMAAQREMYAEHTRQQFEQIKQLTAAVTALANKK